MTLDNWLPEGSLHYPLLAQRLNACLTDAERRVALHAMTLPGMTTKEIAAQMGRSSHTIEAHKKRILKKASEVYRKDVNFGFVLSELKCYFYACSLSGS